MQVFCSSDPFDPLCPLQLDADVERNADSGATAHITPIITGCAIIPPKRLPIKLADHTIVFSAVVVSVAFQPVIEGKSAEQWS